MFQEKWCIEVLLHNNGKRGYYSGFHDGETKLSPTHSDAVYFNTDTEALNEMELNGHQVVQFCIRKFFHNVNR